MLPSVAIAISLTVLGGWQFLPVMLGNAKHVVASAERKAKHTLTI